MLPKSESRTRPTPIHIITTQHHITITIHIIIRTSVHRSSAYGKDYITSHFAAHKAQRLYDIIKGSRNTTDGRTPRRFPILRFKRSRFITDCISSGRDRTERAEQKSELGLLFASEYPICTFHQRYFVLQRTALWRSGIERGATSTEVGALWEVQSYLLRYTHFRLIRLFNSRKSLPISLPIKHFKPLHSPPL